MDSKLFNFLCDGGSKHHPQVWIRLRCMSLNRGRISSVGRALNCRAGGRGFDSRDRTNTQGLKIAEEWRCIFCPANGWTFASLRGSDGYLTYIAVASPQGDVKILPSFKTRAFKMRPSTQPFLRKLVLFAWEWKIISVSKAEHLTSFWYRSPGELGNNKTKEEFERLILQSEIYKYFYQHFGRQAQPRFFSLILSLIAD